MLSVSDSGWTKQGISELCFTDTFLPNIGSDRPQLLIMDGHDSHHHVESISKAREAGIILMELPSKTSHYTQHILEPFSKLISIAVTTCSFQLTQVLDICSLCNRVFTRERDKLYLTRTVIFQLVQALKFKTGLPDENYLLLVQVNAPNENESHCFVRCKAIPSLPSTNKKKCPDYNVWAMLSKMTGCINSADCSCTAEEGEGCNHIAALLYAISDITEKKQDGKLAPTSMKCKWNNPRKRKLTPKKSQDLTFQRVIHGRHSVKRNILVPVYNVKTPVDVDKFKNKLLGIGSNAGWLKNFSEKTDAILIPNLHVINFNYSDSVNLNEQQHKDFFKSYFDSMNITEKECVTIESLTRNQSQSDLWAHAREERLTFSNFGRICKQKITTKPDSILKDLLGYRTFDSVYTKYGRSHESAARRKYEKSMNKVHPGLRVKKCGLLVSPEYPYLGASPDGFVNCTHCDISNGLLEIKCPSSNIWRMKTPEECATDSKFFCTLSADGKVILKTSNIYYYQVQGQLEISGRKWCDFVVWTCMGMDFCRKNFCGQWFFPATDFTLFERLLCQSFLTRIVHLSCKTRTPIVKVKLLKTSISPFVNMFSTLSNYCNFIYPFSSTTILQQ